MIEFLIWLASLCPNPAHTIQNHGSCNMIHVSASSNIGEDTGGETGGTPRPPFPPPPPPPPGGGN